MLFTPSLPYPSRDGRRGRAPAGRRLPGHRVAALVALATLAFPGAPSEAWAQDAAEGSGTDEPILTLAASSLTDILPSAADVWTSRSGTPVRFSFDATSRLAPQIEAGAPADVFVSADWAWIDWLRQRDLLLEGSVREIARNRLVLVVPAPGLEELARLGTIAVGGENVPAGRYAREALLTAGVLDELAPRLVTGGSVRGVLEWVARGEVDGGIVYRTDALVEPDVRLAFVLPDTLHPAVRYGAAVLRTSPRAAEAGAFVDFLAEAAGGVFDDAGFSTAGPSPGTDDPAPESRQEQARRHVPSASLPSVGSAIRLSLLVALFATVLGLAPAVGLGWLLARHDFPGKTLVTTLVLAPLVMPPVVTGFLLLSVLGSQSTLGSVLASMGLAVPFTLVGATVAAFIVGLPLYVLSVRGAFEAVDPQYEELSWTMGVSPRRTFFRISLPLALPGIVAGAILAFARALGEFGATVVLAGNVEGSTRTIALAVYTLLEAPTGRESTWILVGASVALSLLALVGYEALSRWQRRRVRDEVGR